MCCLCGRDLALRGPILWPKRSGKNACKMAGYVGELVFRPHKPDRFTSRDRPNRGWEIDLATSARSRGYRGRVRVKALRGEQLRSTGDAVEPLMDEFNVPALALTKGLVKRLDGARAAVVTEPLVHRLPSRSDRSPVREANQPPR